MREVFADLPEALRQHPGRSPSRAPTCRLPRKPILPRYTKLAGRAEKEALKEMAESGLDDPANGDRLSPDIELKLPGRLAYELDMIEKMGFSGYFLIVADFIQWAKDNGIPVGPGPRLRGGLAGRLVRSRSPTSIRCAGA